tara:strand:- start:596 stop:826 length:231 start_codon:yes stop_codon:yes gene_type:complete
VLKQIITVDITHIDLHITIGIDHITPREVAVMLILRDGILIEIHIEAGMDTNKPIFLHLDSHDYLQEKKLISGKIR